jgi:hypothetical protein
MMLKPRAKAAYGHREQVCGMNHRMAGALSGYLTVKDSGSSPQRREKTREKGEEASSPWCSYSRQK